MFLSKNRLCKTFGAYIIVLAYMQCSSVRMKAQENTYSCVGSNELPKLMYCSSTKLSWLQCMLEILPIHGLQCNSWVFHVKFGGGPNWVGQDSR